MSFVQWYYSKERKQLGPVTEAKLLSLLEENKIDQETLVWSTKMDEWKPLKETSLADVKTEIKEDVKNAVKGIYISPKEKNEENAPLASEPRAFARYFARQFDLIIALLALLIFWPYLLIDSEVQGVLAMMFFWVGGETIFMTNFGTTPGKALLGIKVVKKDGTKISFTDSLKRSFRVYLRGMAIGLPWLSLATMILAKFRLEKKGETTWDLLGGFTVLNRKTSWRRKLLTLLIATLMILLAGIRVAFYIHSAENSEALIQMTNSII